MIDYQNRRITFRESASPWIHSFTLESIKCLIVCRGPVRKEAMEIFDQIGIREYGILLSEKDSVVYPMALAPELRGFRFPSNIHRVPDYMGAGAEEKAARIKQIIQIAKDNEYTHIFAGYGFMAEDSEFIEAIEESGITFMGPSSHVAHQAGSKDEAKKLARKLNVSVTPGVDNISAICLLKKAGDEKALTSLAKEKGLDFKFDSSKSLEDNAEALLYAGYEKIVELVSIADLQAQAEIETAKIWEKFPSNRIRFKYVGGGGGKGQRVVAKPEEVKTAVQEILSESKVTAPGSNRNFLMELNIEKTRHNEIQLIGNGEWCLALGGRDCSVQMHEQKLLEISLTQELLEKEIQDSEKASQKKKAEILKADLQVLKDMEEQSERFGQAVNLNSVSTFELIVDGTNHFFMEMNTRIQVEHRVTEIAYTLKFTNPENKSEFFIVDSLIEAMALLSLHGKRLPKPERVVRNISGAEVRINATNKAIQPHAGGVILNWSKPLPEEIRDDQGISVRNPDTGLFIHYKVAGAYDSNIALLITYGTSREDNLRKLGNILRKTELRGQDLQTNLIVHYGLINWILGKDPMFKPSTAFMISYLAAVGALESLGKDVDLEVAWNKIVSSAPAEAKKVLARKLTLITRPVTELLSDAHLLAGFLGYHENVSWKIEKEKVVWLRNPIFVLSELYYYLHMEGELHQSPSEQIWDHDQAILQSAFAFYKELEAKTGKKADSVEWDAFFSGKAPAGFEPELWNKAVSSHKGFQVGLELLNLIPNLGSKSGFYTLTVDENLEPVIPEVFKKSDTRDAFIKHLAPAPKASSDEIVSPMGGMFYSKEAPDLPSMVNVGDHFKVGQPLFIVEVMKMFNKITAPFSGTIKEVLLQDSDGKIIQKGQSIFKIVPDEVLKIETPEEIQDRRNKVTLSLL
ncbi:HlyD family efflux transporter periplasmic adaptor subunit [Leptospira wolffii]|uniref:ATP-binding protein n=1 Tax=Leptospira wolffii TaxID=409998 RepID=UPI001082C325|nr:biotin/lipoyl-containing protein [Leptospira wolffii]TGK56744.1 HlyD family efflux transporter periplasmic adaptor subunit [Leptospira wolffii]TGK71674.1 HlyD family efflux transporter periplasmic adaptor subunit [Leptospira wolffii]TGK75469.1 HlyD family efflux transporter periplasmic adaptor subunit [Leptospira wolffii]TGL33041.1 HlyD family efflux transporter periplasmic adaptor subunit [Leptospira wolffii]